MPCLKVLNPKYAFRKFRTVNTKMRKPTSSWCEKVSPVLASTIGRPPLSNKISPSSDSCNSCQSR